VQILRDWIPASAGMTTVEFPNKSNVPDSKLWSCLVLLFSLSSRQADVPPVPGTMKTNSILLLLLLFSLCLAGCACVRELFTRRDAPPSQPWVNAPMPTLEEIVRGVNQNSQSIRNFTTENASIHVPGALVPLHSRITFERPKRLRIQGSVSSFGSREIDFGSNDELFWFWARRNDGVMWYCRHELYPMSQMREFVPIEPGMLIEALGIVEFKPTDQHFGPHRLPDGNWEVLSHIQTPSGQFKKRTVFDRKNGEIMRQELYTLQDELIAVAQVIAQGFDRATGIKYARRVEVQSQIMTGTMTIDLGTPTFNRSEPFATSMFLMPQYEGYRAVDLSGPEFLHPGIVVPPPMPNVPSANIQTVIR